MDVKEMSAPEMHVRRMIFQAQGEIALAVSKVVEQARLRERSGDPRRLIGIDAARDPLVTRHLEADDEIPAARLTNGVGDFAHEPDPVFERAAVVVSASIRPG